MPNLRDKILILADDMTGALDSGVQLVGRGLSAVVLPDWHAALSDEEEDCSVVAVNTESRHLPAQEAAAIVEQLVRHAVHCGASRIYKKTDSGLRGNVGAEIAAALQYAGRERIHFIPAYPAAGRTTRNGVQYVSGVPLAQSIFARDPIEPMTESEVAKILQRQTDVPVHVIRKTEPADVRSLQGILLYDAQTDEDLKDIASRLKAEGELFLTAGCAGFLEYMPFTAKARTKTRLPELPKELLVVSGSKNAVTGQQLDAAEQAGAARRHVPVEQILAGTWSKEAQRAFLEDAGRAFAGHSVGILDTLSEVDFSRLPPMDSGQAGQVIAAGMGTLLSRCTELLPGRTLMVIGGDTLQGLIRARSIQKLYPVAELDTGVVLGSFVSGGRKQYVITKSGAFGERDQIKTLQQKLSDLQAGSE
ncbi:MAG: four-carbon acid sugar kinase family protein [Lachnospiraceae bacterium]